MNFKRILKLVDLAKTTDDGLRDCFELAQRFAAEVHLLHIVPPNSIPIFGNQKRLSQSAEKIRLLPIPDNSLRIIREVRDGAVVACLTNYVDEANIELLVLDRADVAGLGVRGANALVNELRERLSIPILLTDSGGHLYSEAMYRANQTLIGQHGGVLEGDQQQTLQTMAYELENQLDITNADALTLLGQMQDQQLLEWKSLDRQGELKPTSVGRWRIHPLLTADASVIRRLDDEVDSERSAAVSLIQRAIEVHATDIHIDPAGLHGYIVQFRIDGRMHEFCRMQQHVAGIIMKQIKLMANVSLADPFHPSESRLELPVSITDHEIRVTTAPVASGEAIAMRIIDGRNLNLPLTDIGLSMQSLQCVNHMVHECSGLILIAGPTGAGKTTTAYSILKSLFNQQQKIISIEDPVELVVPFMRQMNVDQKHGFTMRSALATVLRMDPDAVFVGEIRDAEAARIAFQAAACGKRTVSTIHLRDVAATVTALREFDIDGKTVVESIAGVIAQLLVRRLCLNCRDSSLITEPERQLFHAQEREPPLELPRSRGCPECRGTGYKGRIGIFEPVVVEGAIAEAIRREAHVSELRSLVRKAGAGLVADGLQKVLEGITTIEELHDAYVLDDASLGVNL